MTFDCPSMTSPRPVMGPREARRRPAEEQAKSDLQLAAYYLALRRTPELAALGHPRFLQLDYLGKGHHQDGFVRRTVSPSPRQAMKAPS